MAGAMAEFPSIIPKATENKAADKAEELLDVVRETRRSDET